VREDAAQVVVPEPTDRGCFVIEHQSGPIEVWLHDRSEPGSQAWMRVCPWQAGWSTWKDISPRRIQRVLPGDVRWKDTP
jgi:hypothetical protein